MAFDKAEFTERLKAAAAALNDAADLLDAAKDQDVAYPGKGYLMACLDMALEIVERELPEMKAVAPHFLEAMFRGGKSRL